MPEGVECLIVAEKLREWFKDIDLNKSGFCPIKLVNIIEPVSVRYSPIDFSEFNSVYKNVSYNTIQTFGKSIFIPSNTGHCVMVQLGMTGTFSEQKNRHSRLVFKAFNSKDDFISSDLYYNDMRKFGHLMLFKTGSIPRNMSNIFNYSIDWRNKKAPLLFSKRVLLRESWREAEIKTVLLNQQIIAGIGNIYVSEGLFRSKINPKTRVKNLTEEELKRIIFETQKFMEQSYKVGGMTVKNFEAFGQKGFGKQYLKVYGKNGIICPECHQSIIQRILLKKRSAYYCPFCQVEKTSIEK
jgi:formamidopyrimidine-DNA glycosylase